MVINPTNDKVHRVTFSRDLANFIVGNYYPEYEVRVMRVHRGKRLNPEEPSSGLYGVVSTSKDLLLRVPIRQELAQLYTECDSRHLEEVFLIP